MCKNYRKVQFVSLVVTRNIEMCMNVRKMKRNWLKITNYMI